DQHCACDCERRSAPAPGHPSHTVDASLWARDRVRSSTEPVLSRVLIEQRRTFVGCYVQPQSLPGVPARLATCSQIQFMLGSMNTRAGRGTHVQGPRALANGQYRMPSDKWTTIKDHNCNDQMRQTTQVLRVARGVHTPHWTRHSPSI